MAKRFCVSEYEKKAKEIMRRFKRSRLLRKRPSSSSTELLFHVLFVLLDGSPNGFSMGKKGKRINKWC